MTRGPEVTIVQRRLTGYRVQFFERLRALLAAEGVRLRLLHGDPTPLEATKRDGGHLPWAEHVRTRYLAGDRLCWQSFGAQTRSSDLVVVTQENKLLYNFVAMTVARPPRLAFWGHGANLQAENRDSWKERVKRWTTCKVDWWFAYTELSAGLVRQQGFPPERITVLDNAIDTHQLAGWCASIDEQRKAELCAKWGLRGRHVGLFLGSLYADKRVDFLLDAAEEIRRRVPDFELLIVGAGPLQGRVDAFCANRPWARSLGHRQGIEKAEALAVAHVMLNPGLVGLGILDAFVSRVPLLTVDCGKHGPEIAYLEHGRNGWMVPDGMMPFVEAACLLLTQQELRAQLQSGCAIAAGRYTVEGMARRFADGIGQCLGAPPLGERGLAWRT